MKESIDIQGVLKLRATSLKTMPIQCHGCVMKINLFYFPF